MKQPPHNTRPKGFTLVEMLVVIGVVGVIIGIAVPTLSSMHGEAQSTQCLSNLRQLWSALEIGRQQNRDIFPFATPLPVPADQNAVIPGLPEKLEGIIKRDDSIWLCPADLTQDSEDIGTSYVYVPGAFMLVEPPLLVPFGSPPISAEAHVERVSRAITERFMRSYLRGTPVLGDSGDYHDLGGREPRNAVFVDGNARVVVPSDKDIDPPDE